MKILSHINKFKKWILSFFVIEDDRVIMLETIKKENLSKKKFLIKIEKQILQLERKIRTKSEIEERDKSSHFYN
jgi:hypothetical protein